MIGDDLVTIDPTRQRVTDYIPARSHTVLPTTAYNDRGGGRPGLEGNSTLPPPLIDPSDDDMRKALEARFVKSVPPANGETAAAAIPSAAATVAPPLRTGPPPQPTRNLPATETERTEHMDTPGTDDILQRVLAHPAVVQLLQSEAAAAATSNGPITGAVPLNRDETLSATTVVFSGNFGTYRSKVTDVLIYATHVALLYTDRVGDEDLFFEPPVGQDFVLHVPARDPSQPSQIAVRHYGLTVRLPRFNATLVTFVRGAATATRGDMSDYDFGSDPIAGNTVRIDSNDLNGVNL